jgi:hypothetical protein
MERPPLLCKMRMGPPRGGGGDRRGAHGDGDGDMGMGVNRQVGLYVELRWLFCSAVSGVPAPWWPSLSV